MMPYQVRTFGGLEVLAPEGEPIGAVQPHSKQAALLAYLATRPAGQPVDRSELLPLLWPERTEEKGRRALRALLTRLRARLPDGAIGGKGGDQLWLDASVLTSDVRRFEQALEEDRFREALELYRGPFLEHFQLPDAGPFNRWAEERRSAYRREAFEVALAVGEGAREAGELGKAEGAYRKALDLAPLKEEAAAGLIRVLAARGERADALQFYESFRERLEEDLDLSPSDELEAEVERVRSRPGEGRSERRGPGAPSTVEADSVPGARWFTRSLPLTAALLVAVLLGVGAWLVLRGGSRAEADSAGAARRPTVAVLPFDPLGSAGGESVFRQGLHVGLITRLSNVSGLAVLSRAAVLPFDGAEGNLSAVADTLGAGWVVEGAVQESNGDVQVHVQLIDPERGTQSWAQSYRRELTTDNLFAIQGELTQKIARSLETELSPAEERRVDRRPTGDLAAYRLYVKGRTELDARTDEAIRQAVDYFQRAIERDSSYALAWAGLADAIGLYPAHGPDSVPSGLPGHEEAARRALELGPELAEAHASVGYAHYKQRNVPAALRELRRAVQLKPSYAQAHHWLGLLLYKLGRLEAAREHASLAVELNSRHESARVTLVSVLIARGDLEAAERHLQRLSSEVARIKWKAHLLYHARRWEELETLAREKLEEDVGPEHGWHFYLARIAALRGDTAAARKHLTELHELEAYVVEGLAHAALGEPDSAFSAWGKIENLGKTGPMVGLRFWASDVLAPLREDSRYRELLRGGNQQLGLNPDGSLPHGVDVSFEAQANQ